MKFLTTEQLQEVLQLSYKQAKGLMRVDGFPSVKIGNAYRVEESEMLAWLKQAGDVKIDYSRL